MIHLFKRKKEPTIQDLAKKVEEGEKKYSTLLKEFKAFKDEMRKAVTKVGMVRFNPFNEGGGDQSFCIALLDEDNNGVIVTSHYLREYNRVYAKPVKEGKSEYTLAEEEKQAIDQAIKSEARNPKSATNSNDRNSKSKT